MSMAPHSHSPSGEELTETADVTGGDRDVLFCKIYKTGTHVAPALGGDLGK